LTRGAPSGPRNMQPIKSPASNPSYISETSLGHSLMPTLDPGPGLPVRPFPTSVSRLPHAVEPPLPPPVPASQFPTSVSRLPHSLSPSRTQAPLRAPTLPHGRPRRLTASPASALASPRPRPIASPRPRRARQPRRPPHLAGESSSPAGTTTHPFPRSHLPSGRIQQSSSGSGS
jgi:hypothetical protein